MLCTAYKGHVHHTLLLMYELASTGLGMASRVFLHLDLLYTLPTPIEGVLLFSCGFLTCCTPAPFDRCSADGGNAGLGVGDNYFAK